MKSWEKIFLVLAIVFWLATGCAIISRVLSIFNDSTLTFVPPESDRWLCSRPVAEKANFRNAWSSRIGN